MFPRSSCLETTPKRLSKQLGFNKTLLEILEDHYWGVLVLIGYLCGHTQLVLLASKNCTSCFHVLNKPTIWNMVMANSDWRPLIAWKIWKWTCVMVTSSLIWPRYVPSAVCYCGSPRQIVQKLTTIWDWKTLDSITSPCRTLKHFQIWKRNFRISARTHR